MSASDREKWDARYRAAGQPLDSTDANPPAYEQDQPSSVLVALDAWLPRRGRALDVAGGAGRHALWLARRGLDVTLCDISPVALELAQRRARAAGLSLRTWQCDLELACQPECPRDLDGAILPTGPWDLILSVLYLQRPLFPVLIRQLAAEGTLVVIQPTRTNLDRRAKPPAEYLLEDGELPRLAEGLEILHHEEGWLADGRHDAVLVARRPQAAGRAVREADQGTDRDVAPASRSGDSDREEGQAG